MTGPIREPEAGALTSALDEVARPLRGMSGLARLLMGVAAALLALAGAAWLSRVGIVAPAWVLLAWALAIVALIGGLILARRAIRALGPWHVGQWLERLGAWRNGALTTVLDAPAVGTSASLHAAAEMDRASEVRERAPAVMAPELGRQRGLSRNAAIAIACAIVALVAARPATGTTLLWDPIGAWNALTAPVRLVARKATVSRGEPAVLDVTAIGHRSATLFTRAPGEAWRTSEVTLDGAGHGVITTAPLAADLVARVEAGGRRSEEVRVGIRLAAFLGAFTVTANYPAYLGLGSEALPVGGDTLVLPEGTRLAISGRATTALAAARLEGPSGNDSLVVDGSAFHGDLVPRVAGMWRLVVKPVSGGVLEGDLPALPIRIVPDSAPVVEIPVPGVDTVAPASLSLALVVAARDDHGLASAAFEFKRGTNGAPSRAPLALPPGGGDRALVTTVIDLVALGLKPGDTLHYTALAQDNAPARHEGRSREYLVRLPTEAEQRAARARETTEAAKSLDSLSAQAGRVQRTTEDLAKERQRGDTKSGDQRTGDDAQKDPLSLETARRAQAAAQAQEKVLDDAAKLEKALEDLKKAAERDGVADSALARQLSDIAQLLDKAMSPELREQLNALRDALKNLDASKTKEALQDLAKQQALLKEALDRAKEFLKRAQLETDLGNLAQEAKQVGQEQHELTPQLGKADSGKSTAAERALAQRADSLAAAIDRAADRVPSDSTKRGLQSAASDARSAAQKMNQAAQQAQEGKPGEAKASGKDAEDKLDPLDEKLKQQRQDMQAAMKAEVVAALNRALQETARLAQQQLDVADAFQRGAPPVQTRAAQGLVEEGAGKLLQQVLAVEAKNALVSAQAGAALSAARESMRSAVVSVSTSNPNIRDAAQQAGDAVDALSVAAFNLLLAKDKVDGSKSGSGLQEAMEQMQKMAGQQGQLAQQGQSMLQQGQSAMQQMMQMAMQQRALAQQLERMRATGQLPGAGEMGREAKDLAHQLEAGKLTPETVDREQRLFKKMLDAGRTLQGEEKDENKERQATAAKDRDPRAPAALDPRVRNGQGDIRLPSWETLQQLSPEDRRRVVDYFRRLAGVGGP